MFIGKHTIKINFISVNLIVCPAYELTFLIGMKYRGKKNQTIQGPVGPRFQTSTGKLGMYSLKLRSLNL